MQPYHQPLAMVVTYSPRGPESAAAGNKKDIRFPTFRGSANVFHYRLYAEILIYLPL